MPGYSVRTLPFFAHHNVMLTMLVCATRWLFMHLYMLAYLFMHKFFLLVCHTWFNTMKLWAFDPNLHLPSWTPPFVCFLACLPSRLFACFLGSLLAMSIMLICFLVCLMPLSCALSLLVYWLLVFTFTCTHTKRGCMELGHGLPSASEEGKDVSIST